MITLEKAIVIAAKAHAGQVDKVGLPYILHPLRVMLAQSSNDARIVAVLHDVVEDTGVTMQYLKALGFGDVVLEALDSVTKREGEEYEAFVLRAAAHPIGCAVKMADLRDNMDLSRIANPTERDFARIRKYQHALALVVRVSSSY